MSLQPEVLTLLALAFFTFLGISKGLYVDSNVPKGQDIDWSDEKSSTIIIPSRWENNSSELAVKKTCKDVNELRICTEVGNTENGTHYAQEMRYRRAAKKESAGHSSSVLVDADSLTSCFVPSRLETAEIRCKVMPSSITCKSYCIFGHTYDEGIVRTQSCKFAKNVWSAEFEECTPFIDCSLKLVSPGSLKCHGSKVTDSPKCEIECEVYEDKDALPKQVYSCKSDGSWNPFLPFCAVPRGVQNMANAPKVVEQSRVDYP